MPQTNRNSIFTLKGQVKKGDQYFSKFRIFKNLMVIAIGTFFILAADDLVITYQSTLNRDKSVGIASIAVQYAFSCLSSFFLPKYLVLKFGSKNIMILSIVLFTPFFVANYYPVYYLMMLTSMLNGVGFSLLWGSVDPYINGLSSMYAADRESENLRLNASEERTLSMEPCNCLYSVSTSESCTNARHHSNNVKELQKNSNCKTIDPSQAVKQVGEEISASHIIPRSANQNKTRLEAATVRFFSFHSMIYQTCYIFGNLSSFFVLQRDYSPDPQTTSLNETCLCGIEYCNVESPCSERNLQQPSTEARTIIISICVSLSVLAAVTVVGFLDDLEKKEKNVSFSADMVWATFKQIKKKNNLLLAPLVINLGLTKGFYLGDFTKSYIGCAWGLRYVGLVTVCASVCMVVFSTGSGWLTKHLGRLPDLFSAFILNAVHNVILITWQPDASSPAMFFVSAALYGGFFGTHYTQGRALYGVLFRKDEEAAFGAFQLLYCVASCLCLSYSDHLCNDIKVYLMTVASILGIIGYLVVERGQSTRDMSSVIPHQNSETNVDEVTRF